MQSNFSANPSRSNSSRSNSSRSLEAEFANIAQRQRQTRIQTALQRGAIALLNFLTGQQTLSIRTRQHSSGKTQWIVYDPHTDRRQVFDSQQAVRRWVEERYYQ